MANPHISKNDVEIIVTRINTPTPLKINHILSAVSPLVPSPPVKTHHPPSLNVCFLDNPRCRNALRNVQTSLKTEIVLIWRYSLSLRNGEKSLKLKKSGSKWLLSGRFGDSHGRPGDSFRVRENWHVCHSLSMLSKLKAKNNCKVSRFRNYYYFFCEHYKIDRILYAEYGLNYLEAVRQYQLRC